jgi:hypothetical protein
MNVSFEWYLKTFRSIHLSELTEEEYDTYHDEFEIWLESSGRDKRRMWPISETHTCTC